MICGPEEDPSFATPEYASWEIDFKLVIEKQNT